MSKRRTQAERSATTRRQILEAATCCLAELGAASTLEVVAARANVSRGALQHQFGTREDLLIALVDDLGEKLISPYEKPKVHQKLTLSQRVDLAIDRDWDTLRSPQFVAVMQIWLAMQGAHDLSSHVSTKVSEIERHLDAHWVQLFADASGGAKRIKSLRHLVFSTLRGLAIRSLYLKDAVAWHQEIAILKEMVELALAPSPSVRKSPRHP